MAVIVVVGTAVAVLAAAVAVAVAVATTWPLPQIVLLLGRHPASILFQKLLPKDFSSFFIRTCFMGTTTKLFISRRTFLIREIDYPSLSNVNDFCRTCF